MSDGPGSPARPRLVIATANPDKLVELDRILAASGVAAQLVTLADFPSAPDVVETGATFVDNALLKARAIAAFTGLPAVADDSGLCADALHGMPGVFSARWSGGHGDALANLNLLLAQLTDVPDDRRGAHFACAAVLVLPVGIEHPAGAEHISEGAVHGRLIREPRGSNGFGYDPIFVPDGDHRTTAELSPEEKDAISHRSRALHGLLPAIAAALGG